MNTSLSKIAKVETIQLTNVFQLLLHRNIPLLLELIEL